MIKPLATIFFCLVPMLPLAGQGISVPADFPRERLVQMLTGKYWRSDDSVAVVRIVGDASAVRVVFTEAASTVPVTAEKIGLMADSVRRWLNVDKTKISFIAGRRDLANFVAQWHMPPVAEGVPIVGIEGRQTFNLANRNFALWNSHGCYHERSLDRWEWQRARLFTTVEDLLTSSFVLPFLAPMLENGGARVFLPRERDTQPNMVVADNDSNQVRYVGTRLISKAKGYAHTDIIRNAENPFALGTAEARQFAPTDTAIFSLTVPTDGQYAVYVCYAADPQNAERALYTVRDADGPTQYAVNQRRGGGMWIYLGTHWFSAASPAEISITGHGRLSVDAVRLGGGRGIVERGGTTSGRPRWTEGARYYLQADGFDAATVYSLSNDKNDYTDDVNARGEWVNALIKKNIPIDAAIALHTDAGTAAADTCIGTLTIVSTTPGGGRFPDGRRRTLSRAMAQTIENEIVGDIRATWDSCWSLRGIWDKGYSEARRANVPSVLVEMLSHQNLNDMRFALHPQFRFDVARAIYKALLQCFAGAEAVVQPLPPSRFGMRRTAADTLQLAWRSTADPLEPTARADSFDIFANGRLVATTADTSFALCQPADGRTVTYYIVSRNGGGVSFPSARLSARLVADAPDALLVDGFDRLASPAAVRTGAWAGFVTDEDAGVPWPGDVFTTGRQFDFDPRSPWTDDDSPGWGASFGNLEGVVLRQAARLPHGTFARLVGEGFSVISATKDFFENSTDSLTYKKIAVSLGRQRSTWYGNMEPRHSIYTQAFMRRMEAACASGAMVEVRGCHVGSDIASAEAEAFAARVLGFRFRSGHASATGVVVGRGGRIEPAGDASAAFGVPPCDAIEPAQGRARTILRYEDSRMSAAVRFGNVTVYGFDGR